jgi:hypothetical protein
MTNDLEAAWDAVHDATPVGWTVQRPRHHAEAPGAPWHVVASNPRALAKDRRYVQASGATEAAALRHLAERLKKETSTTGGTAGGLDHDITPPEQ